MYSKTNTVSLIGLEGKAIEVESDITSGMPSFNIVGLPDSSIKESKERIRVALINSGYKFPLGRITINLSPADIKKEGTDVTVITYGLCVHMTMQVAERLAKENINVHLLDLRTVYPIDKQAVIEAANKTGKVLLVTEDNKEGSILGEVAAIIAENCLFELDAPVRRLAAPDAPSMPYAQPLEKAFLINEEKIEKEIRDLALF